MDREKMALLDELNYFHRNYKQITYGVITKIMNKISLLSSYDDMAEVALKLARVSNYISDPSLLSEIIKYLSTLLDNVMTKEATSNMLEALCIAYYSIGFDYKVVEYGLKYANSDYVSSKDLYNVYNRIAISCFEIEEYGKALDYLEKSNEEFYKYHSMMTTQEIFAKYTSQVVLYHINKAMFFVFLNDTKYARIEMAKYNQVYEEHGSLEFKESYKMIIAFYNIYLEFMIGNDREK